MIAYYISYTTITIISLWFFHNKRLDVQKSRRLFCLIAFIIFSLLLALRHPSMGIDLGYGTNHGYLVMFSYIKNMDWKQVFTSSVANYERGYIVFNKIIGIFFSDSQALLVISGFICIASISYQVYKNSKLPLLSFIIYLGLPSFLLNFSGLRQAIAISITIFAFSFIQKKKPIPFVLIVILASFFHSSALVFLLAYPLYYVKTNARIELYSMVALPVVFLLRYPLFHVVSSVFKQNAVPDNNSAVTLFIVFSLIYVFAIVFKDGANGKEVGYRNIFYVACVIQAFGSVYSTAIRVGYYFMIYLALLLPEIITHKTLIPEFIAHKTLIKKYEHINFNAIMYVVVFICFAVFGLYALSKSSWALTNPYHFFWD